MLFAIKIFDQPDSGELRDIHRKAHLDYLALFDDATLFAGPFTTDDGSQELGSFRILDLADRAAVDQHIAGEPFIQEGVQYGAVAHRFKAVAPYSFRDCPRKEGNIQVLVHALDRPNSETIRNEFQPKHKAFLDNLSDNLMARGPLLTDDGEHPVGSAFLFDVPDVDTAKSLWEQEPYNQNGVFETVEIYRWRFGRIFDRFAKKS